MPRQQRNPRPPKRIRHLVDVALAHGWTYDTTARGHPRLSPPPGLRDRTGEALQAPVVFSMTPSDRMADMPAITALRRAGVPIPRK